MDVWGALRSLVSRGKVTGVVRGQKTLLNLQMLSGEARQNVEWVQPWGFTSRPTGGDAVVLQVGGVADQVVVVAVDDAAVRIHDLLPGECGLSNGQTQIICRQGGLQISTTGTITLGADGGQVITGASVSIGALGATVRKLVNDQFEALFNSHTHPGNNRVPDQHMDASHLTSDTQAS